MKLIIEIPDKDYEFIKRLKIIISGRRNFRTLENNVMNAIKNGIPYKERQKGKWIFDVESSNNCAWFCCSECHAMEKMEKDNLNARFCWNCGAQMGGDN